MSGESILSARNQVRTLRDKEILLTYYGGKLVQNWTKSPSDGTNFAIFIQMTGLHFMVEIKEYSPVFSFIIRG